MFDFVNTDPFLLFFGSFYMVVGLSMFLARPAWEGFMNLFAKDEAITLMSGIMTLPVGLFIVVFYNSWDGVGSIVLMVIGYIALIKAVLLLVKPAMMQKVAEKRMFMIKPFWMNGIPALLIGAALLIL